MTGLYDASGGYNVSLESEVGVRVEGTITTGGTAQNAFSTTPLNGFEIYNAHSTETLYIREAGTATAADNSFNVAITPRSTYTTPVGYKPTGDVSVIAATTGHAFVARRW